MFIRSKDVTHPVLLYLHGGIPDYFLTRSYPTGLEDYFTVVWWEQRGSGLSYSADIPPETMTVEQLVSDTLEVTNYLRHRFGKEKTYLMGHSTVTAMTILATGLWAFDRFVNWAERSVSESPEVAVRVADYEVPEGFGAPYSIHFGDVTMIGYKSTNEKSYILLAQFPDGTSINVDEMLRIIRDGSSDPNSFWYNTETTVIEQNPVTIRGQGCTLNISEGTSAEGVTYHSAIATFEGRSGPSLVMIAGPMAE